MPSGLVRCFIERKASYFILKFREFCPHRETVHRMESDVKSLFFQIFAIFDSTSCD